MKFTLDNRTGTMVPARDPRKEIQNAVRRDSSIEKGHLFTDCTRIREDLAMCAENGNAYCAVRINGQWRCIGRVTDMAVIRKASYGPLTDFHTAWMSGTEIQKPQCGK